MYPLLALPKCVALRSKHDNGYLRAVHDESHGGSMLELSGSADDGGIMNPRFRFYLEPSKEHEGLVHVRCCCNNKYWVPQERVLQGSACWIVGTADEPEEDVSKASCTLFKPTPVDGDEHSIGFLHSQLGKYAGLLSSADASKRPYLHIAREDEGEGNNLIDAFTFIDVSSQKQLPLYVAFKGPDGKFLGGTWNGSHMYLQFGIDDIGHPSVAQRIYTNNSYGDGIVRIKLVNNGYFWRRSPDWIWADDDSEFNWGNSDTRFRVITGDDFIALQNQGNNNFCKGLTADGKTNCLNAAVNSITAETRLKCYEPVVSRRIYDVKFRLNEARTYTKEIEGLSSLTAKNESSEEEESELSFTYTNIVSSSWSSTVSMKIAIKTSLQSGIPFVVDGSIEVETEFSGSYEWGKTETEERQDTKKITVKVPPKKEVIVRAVGSNGVCDIPFSYKQTDILYNGQEVTQEFTDGLYTGVKTSDIWFDTREEDLE